MEKGSTMNLTQAIDHIRPSIVQISLYSTSLPEEIQQRIGRPFIHSPLGTGFIVNSDGYVITARHVIQYGRQSAEQVNGEIIVGFAIPNTENMRGNFILVNFDVVDEDDRHDLALLKLRKNPFKGEVRSGQVIQGKEVPILFGTVTLNPNRPRDGEAVGISGYPLGEPVLVTNAGWMATSWAFKIDPYAVPIPGTSQWFRLPEVADVYLADVEVNPGDSGAPVYSIDNAVVVGVCVGSKPAPVRDQSNNDVHIDGRTLLYSSGLTSVVPTRYVIELLRKNDLNWSQVIK